MNIIDDIGLITVFLLVLLSVFLLVNISQNKTANILFAIFLLTTSFGMSALFLADFYSKYILLNRLRVAAVFLQTPFFYFYIMKACFSDFEIKWKQILHTIPFLTFVTIFFTVGITNQIDIWYAVISQLQFYIYMIAVFYALSQYKRLHNESHSLKNRAYFWLMSTSILFVLGNTLVLLRGIFQVFNDYQTLPILNIGISLFGLSVISWFVLKTMRHPELFTRVFQSSAIIKNQEVDHAKTYEEDIAKISDYMDVHKPYLKEAITLQRLAEEMSIPEKHLSFLINKVMGQHFFDFINKYRIEEAKKLLQKDDLNIQQIMYEVGFNSKSSFNTAFKKNTSKTPSTFRKSS